MIKVTAIYQQDPPPFRQWHLLMPIMLLALGLLLILATHVNYFRGVPGDLGDARFNGIILEYFYRWVSGGNESLLNPEFFIRCLVLLLLAIIIGELPGSIRFTAS